MMINDLRPTLTKVGDNFSFTRMDDTSVRYMFNYSEKQEKPRDVPLWGHLVNENYMCPPGIEWKNADSDYDNEVVVVEPTKPKTKRKKAQVVDEALEAVGVEQPTRKRAALAWRPRVRSSSAATTSAGTQDPPSHSTVPEQPETGSSQQTSTELPSLSASLISLMAKVERLEEENRERKKEVERLDREKAKMRKEVDDANLLLLKANEKNDELEKRLKDMEDCYDENQKIMVLDNRGYFRHVDRVAERDLMRLPGAEDAGTSGTSPE